MILSYLLNKKCLFNLGQYLNSELPNCFRVCIEEDEQEEGNVAALIAFYPQFEVLEKVFSEFIFVIDRNKKFDLYDNCNTYLDLEAWVDLALTAQRCRTFFEPI